MSKKTLDAVFISLLSVLGVACGDPGDATFDEEISAEDVFDGDGVGVDDELGAQELGGGEPIDRIDEDVFDQDGRDSGGGLILEPLFACGNGTLEGSETCDDGNEEDGDGCSGTCEVEPSLAEARIAIDVTVSSSDPGDAPASAACVGGLLLEVSPEAIVAEGRCDLSRNFLDFVLDVDVSDDGSVEGEIDIILNGSSNIVSAVGLLEDGVLVIELDGVTQVSVRHQGIWSGKILADVR